MMLWPVTIGGVVYSLAQDPATLSKAQIFTILGSEVLLQRLAELDSYYRALTDARGLPGQSAAAPNTLTAIENDAADVLSYLP